VPHWSKFSVVDTATGVRLTGVPDDIFVMASGLVRDIPAYDMRFTKDADFWPELEEVVDARR